MNVLLKMKRNILCLECEPSRILIGHLNSLEEGMKIC